MSKVGGLVEKDVLDLAYESGFEDAINGSIYLEGARPINSDKEDIVVSFMTGLDGQIQTGVVNINIYISNIDNGSGVFVKDTKRCREMEVIANTIVKSFKHSDYIFSLGAMIKTFRDEDIEQHFVNVKLKFKSKSN